MSYCNLFNLSYKILSKGFVPSKGLGGEVGLKRCLCPPTHLLVGVEMGKASLECRRLPGRCSQWNLPQPLTQQFFEGCLPVAAVVCCVSHF